MNKILNIYKPAGLTPLQLINKLREARPEYKDVKIGYAGRLDPMARGILLLMIGGATRERDNYLELDKEYVFDVLFGSDTDTYDLLGIANNVIDAEINVEVLKAKLDLFCVNHKGSFLQKYPPYSSKAVNGKAMFEWSRENRLGEIETPEKKINIYDLKVLTTDKVSTKDLLEIIHEKVNLISGDFRQNEILKQWDNLLKSSSIKYFPRAKFEIKCSSGTYVRSLANKMGSELGTGAIAVDIFRTKVGTYDISDSIRVLTK